MRPYSPRSRLNTFAPAPGAPVGPPTPSLQRLHPGLPGYLIPFAPLGFVPDRRIRSSATPSPLVVLPGLQDFTPTPGVPRASPGPKSDGLPEFEPLSGSIYPGIYPTGYGRFRLNNNEHHSGRGYYRGGWHPSYPALTSRAF